MSASPIDAIAALSASQGANNLTSALPLSGTGTSFVSMLTHGIGNLEHKVEHANQMAQAFVLDDTIPVHQVTFAMEEARMSLDLMLQVRSRVVEAYQQLMAMQL